MYLDRTCHKMVEIYDSSIAVRESLKQNITTDARI